MRIETFLGYKDGLFYYYCPYEERHIPRNAGLQWVPSRKCWCTPFVYDVTKLPLPSLSTDAKNRLNQLYLDEKQSYNDSFATESSIYVPAPEGLSYYDFQRAGVEYMLDRDNTLLADEMGLGKTIQVIGLINYLDFWKEIPKRILIICPATAKLMWAKALKTWLIADRDTAVIRGRTGWQEAEIIIVNYDLLTGYDSFLKACEWDLLILDESHYIKNYYARRTQVVIGQQRYEPIRAVRKLALTGTPLKNRVIETYTVLKYLYPDAWPGYRRFAEQYANARQTMYGWDDKGASNLGEFQHKLRSKLMLRRRKKDVLKDLPPKHRQIIEVDVASQAARSAISKEQNRWRKVCDKLGIKSGPTLDEEDYRKLMKVLVGGMPEFDDLSVARHEAALAKVPAVIQHVKDLLREKHKVVVFAWHRDVVAQIQEAFGVEAVVLIGGMSELQKARAEERFQTDDSVRVFIGNILAAGQIITLTAASNVVFAELTWVPGDITQAEDRCWRIGTTENVLIQHLVLEDSVDALLAATIVRKQEVIDEAIDDEATVQLLQGG
jgi:SWI/SNF-related matrix-associated actin-dependent regulator 1 of chromatin subfamily A